MPLFTLNRDHTLVTVLGRSVEFKKDKPTHVPPELTRLAVGIGAVPSDGTQVDVLDPVKVEAVVPVGTEREDLICTGFDDLIKTNNRADFTGNGVPTTKAMQRVWKSF